MAYLRYLNSGVLHRVTVTPLGNVVTVSFDGEKVVSTAGFDLFLDDEGAKDIGGDAYHSYTTVYRDDEFTWEYNGYQLSSDGSVYVEPEPLPEPEPYQDADDTQQVYISDRQLISEQNEAIMELAEQLGEQDEAIAELADMVSSILEG